MERESLLDLLREDMQPALGVTEPGAIAFAAAKAKSYIKGPAITKVIVTMNSGMYKNAFTCGIPNSGHVGNSYAAALGIIAGNAEKGLEALAEVLPEDDKKAQQMLEDGIISIRVSGISSRIFIEAEVQAYDESCTVTIMDKHTNIVKIVRNGQVIFEKPEELHEEERAEDTAQIHRYTMQEIYDFVQSVPVEELVFIRRAFDVNMELFQAGLDSTRTGFVKGLYRLNDNTVFSKDEVTTAELLCNGAIEARVIGLDKPAMSITGSGAHGIICTMPLLAVSVIRQLPEEKLLRATALSYLVTMYIKEYSGRLSAFCGCAIAAGTGMACALAYMKGGGLREIKAVVNNMAASITGMICDGGNQGCTMKGIVAVDAAFRSVRFALQGICIDDVHSILASTMEQTFRNMGRIASPGMIETEQTIIDIFEEKQRQK